MHLWSPPSARARSAFLDPDNRVFLSSVSAWEITVKHALGKLPLPDVPERLVPEARERLRIQPLPLEEGAVLGVNRLPDVHQDPFHRMLVCQAIAHGLTIVTDDEAIRRYPAPTLW